MKMFIEMSYLDDYLYLCGPVVKYNEENLYLSLKTIVFTSFT